MPFSSLNSLHIFSLDTFDLIRNSGQAAVITPRQVIFGLGSRRVRAIAAAKHHTVIATEGGEVFTWGSNRGKIFWMSLSPYIHTFKGSTLNILDGAWISLLISLKVQCSKRNIGTHYFCFLCPLYY